ncbi:MAG: tRNA (adenosine(37)-N6)-dimethylallyltransferase MiaA [Patescibacteria group bacterium]|nr:tRNA (adenosine(37)-N6)-dimethylallyltransferase MiaA [Patescibacteria group bacterium]
MTEEEVIQKLDVFLQTAEKPLVVLLGPTASGKTSLSLKLAKKFNGEVISADSRQLYKGMQIGTDTLPMEKRQGIPHHMIEVLEPDEQFTVAEYKQKAAHIINQILRKKKVPFLVGGTGLYISAIVENYEIPQIPPDFELRNQLQKDLEKQGVDYLYRQLQAADPITAERTDPKNPRFVMRALEIVAAGQQKSVSKKKPLYDTFLIGIDRPREELYEKIEKRVDEQVERGLLKEVEKLMEQGYNENLPAITALGIKEIIPYLRGEMSLEEALDTIKRNTRNYAKRQFTWFKRYKNINWIQYA